MAIRRYGVAIGSNQPVSSTADLIATEKTTALAVPAIDADTDAEAAVAAIGTTQGTAAVRLLVDTTGSPTKAQIRAAVERILAHIDASNEFA